MTTIYRDIDGNTVVFDFADASWQSVTFADCPIRPAIDDMCAKMGESSSAMDDFWRGVMERTQPQTRSAVMPNPYGGLTAQREYTASEIAHGKAIAKAIGGR